MNDLASRLTSHVQLTTNGHAAYLSAVEGAFGAGIDYAMIVKVRQFSEGGESRSTRHPHPFFGSLTPQAWSRGMYKHLDHHLLQFGV